MVILILVTTYILAKTSAFSPPIDHRHLSPLCPSVVAVSTTDSRVNGRSPVSSEARVPFASSSTAINMNKADDETSKDDHSGDDNDAAFYQDLEKAKREKLGSELPPDQLRESALSAESEFLQAMEQSKEEYREAKERDEDISASDFFLRKIQQEEEEEARGQQLEDEDEDDTSAFE
jgi:hypothetical protein